MRKLISFSLIILFLLLSLFFTAKIVQAASLEVFWNSPAPYNPSSPIVYQRGQTVTFSGTVTVASCSNNPVNIDISFSIETITGNTKSWTTLGKITVAAYLGQTNTFSTNYVLPSNTYIGLPYVRAEYFSELWGGVWSGYKEEYRQIRVSSPPTAPGVNVIPDTPYPSDSLTCIIATSSTSIDPNATGITYTYEWYKNGALQSSLTKSNTTAATYTVSPTLGSGQSWQCRVIPKNSAGLTGSYGQDTVTISSMSFQPKIFSNIGENLKKGFSEVIRIFERFAEENKKLFSFLY